LKSQKYITETQRDLSMQAPSSPNSGPLDTAERYATLVSAVMPQGAAGDLMRIWLTRLVLVVAGSALLAVSAQFKIALYPVPVTGQTLVVILIAMTYGPRLGGATVIAYLAQGLVGLPVFAAGGSGVLTLLGPTGGYLAGFLVAAIAMGMLAERGMGRGIISTFSAMMIGTALIYVCGVVWLSNFVGGIPQALQLGLVPFIYGDLLKMVVAAGLMPAAWAIIRKFEGK